MNSSLLLEASCSFRARMDTRDYLFFKLLRNIYLRLLIGPGILLNTLCLIVLSRPRLSNKSTTIVFLRFLAIFDVLSITLKYIRAELNYQSVEREKNISILTLESCKALYVSMNTCISIAMWTIVLMSVDKAVAVSYPLKSSIWVTQKRALYVWYFTSVILFLANLSLIDIAQISLVKKKHKHCGLSEKKSPIIVDILTASMLPIGLITAANFVIVIILRRVSRLSFGWPMGTHPLDLPSLDSHLVNKRCSSRSYRSQSLPSSSIKIESHQIKKRRTNAQITCMLLAVTASLIIFNIPNTITSLFITKINNLRTTLRTFPCEAKDYDIQLYKYVYYLSVIQDILSDLPHIVNFFLYCLAGRKFRSIFRNEVRHFLIQMHLIKRKPRCFTHTENIGSPNVTNTSGSNWRQCSSRSLLLSRKSTVNVLFNGATNELILCHRNSPIPVKQTERYHPGHVIRIYSSLH